MPGDWLLWLPVDVVDNSPRKISPSWICVYSTRTAIHIPSSARLFQLTPSLQGLLLVLYNGINAVTLHRVSIFSDATK